MVKNIREKAILIGLYLSKFDMKGLESLGFGGFIEAYNTLGFSIGAKPASLKNYRDEFDPVFPNERKGRRNRPMREYCKKVYNEYADLDFVAFSKLMLELVSNDSEIKKIVKGTKMKDYSDSVARRLITGKAAEEYFKCNYKTISDFNEFDLKDTTNLGCGFDFKLSNHSNFYCVEVKGLSGSSGSVSFTEKEFNMAKTYTKQFCLFIVKNFVERPYHDYYFDPLNSRLTFKKTERQIIQVNYLTSI